MNEKYCTLQELWTQSGGKPFEAECDEGLTYKFMYVDDKYGFGYCGKEVITNPSNVPCYRISKPKVILYEALMWNCAATKNKAYKHLYRDKKEWEEKPYFIRWTGETEEVEE